MGTLIHKLSSVAWRFAKMGAKSMIPDTILMVALVVEILSC
jgi:hypothetical protein